MKPPALAALVLACIVGCGRAPESPASRTPLLEAVRLEAPWSASQRSAARAGLERIFAAAPFQDAGLVVLADDGRTLFQRYATKPMTPASTLKLLVAATSLEVLGPQRRFETSFDALDEPDATGTLSGPLWLVGEGDPLFDADDLRRGIAALARHGLRRAAGGIIVDASAFRGPEQNPYWDPADLVYDYAAGTSAVSFNWDVVEFRVNPTSTGRAAQIEVRPASAAVAFAGRVLTAAEGAGSFVNIVRDASSPDDAERNAFVISGHIAPGSPQSLYVPVHNIAEWVGAALNAMLAERGITVAGGAHVGRAPLASRTLWLHRSRPLAGLAREMLVYSDNHTAEQLLRILGFETGRGGTEAGGIRIERAFLSRHGIPADGVRLVDACGLSPDDRVPPLVLARILEAGLRSATGAALLGALPLVGREGTVRHLPVKAALGRARAKSGHIDGVSALAGTVMTAHHGRVVFAFVVNGPQADAGGVNAGIVRALDFLATS